MNNWHSPYEDAALYLEDPEKLKNKYKPKDTNETKDKKQPIIIGSSSDDEDTTQEKESDKSKKRR